MPAPDHSIGQTVATAMLHDMVARAMQPPSLETLADEVDALRREVDELREQLERAPSLILTGERVAAEMRRLMASEVHRQQIVRGA